MDSTIKDVNVGKEDKVDFTELSRERRALDHVINFMEKSRRFRKNYEDTWSKIFAEYINSRSVKANALQRANLKLPYAFTTIETFVPQIVETFLAEAPYVSAVGRGLEDAEDAEKISAHFSYQLDQMKFFNEFVPFTKNMLIYGTAIAKTGWKYQEKQIRVNVREPNKLGLLENVQRDQTITTYDNPSFENIELVDFFPDWSCSKPADIQSMRGCVHRVYRTYDELKSLKKTVVNGEEYGIYSNLDKLKQSYDKSDNAWANMKTTPEEWAQFRRASALNQEPGLKNRDKIEVWEFWGLFDLKDNGQKIECVITIANGDTVIRVDSNPYDYAFKPFVAGVDYIIPGEFYGMGEIEFVLSLIKEATALRNARLDQANQAVNRMWLVDRNAGINVRNLYSRAGGIVLTNDINGVRGMEVPEVPGSSYREISQIDFDIQNATAQINASQGASNIGRAFGSTATGVSYLQGFTSSRLSLKVRQIEKMVMHEFGKILLMLNRQFVRNDLWVKLYNDDKNPFVRLAPESFFREYDFMTTGAVERLNRQGRQQMFQQAIIPFLQFVEQADPGTVNIPGLTKRFFKEYDYKNVNELLNPPEEKQRIMQQRMMESQQQIASKAQADIQSQIAIEGAKNQMKSERDEKSVEHKANLQVVKGLVNAGSNILTNAARA